MDQKLVNARCGRKHLPADTKQHALPSSPGEVPIGEDAGRQHRPTVQQLAEPLGPYLHPRADPARGQLKLAGVGGHLPVREEHAHVHGGKGKHEVEEVWPVWQRTELLCLPVEDVRCANTQGAVAHCKDAQEESHNL